MKRRKRDIASICPECHSSEYVTRIGGDLLALNVRIMTIYTCNECNTRYIINKEGTKLRFNYDYKNKGE